MKVLIVDDSKAVRQYVEGILKEMPGTVVDQADSGFEAFRRLAREIYDFVVTDLNMPDINGLELIQFIKKSDRHGQTKVVVITTQATDRMREKFEALKVDGFLGKPFDPDTLVSLITNLLSSGTQD